ncbi:MAG: divergent polysaccharide deacetylase family protein [Pikeienuella sp.]
MRFLGGLILGIGVVGGGLVALSLSNPVTGERRAALDAQLAAALSDEPEPVPVIAPEIAPADPAVPGPVPQPSAEIDPSLRAAVIPGDAPDQAGFSPPPPVETPVSDGQFSGLPPTATLEGPAPINDVPRVEDPLFQLQGPALSLNSASFERRGNAPLMAVILEDAGQSDLSREVLLSLPMPLTLGITPRGEDEVRLASAAKLENYEILVQIPVGPAPESIISPEMSDVEVADRVEALMAELWMSIGAASRVAQGGPLDERIMRSIIPVLERNGFAMINTDPASLEAGRALALAFGVAYSGQTASIAAGTSEEEIYAVFSQVAAAAAQSGGAIVSAPASLATLRALNKWAIENSRLAQIAPLSAVISELGSR